MFSLSAQVTQDGQVERQPTRGWLRFNGDSSTERPASWSYQVSRIACNGNAARNCNEVIIMSQYVKQVEVESLKVGPNLQFTQLLQLDVQTSVQVGLLRTDSPIRDWRSTLHNWRFCQVQIHETKTRTSIIKNPARSNLDIVGTISKFVLAG